MAPVLPFICEQIYQGLVEDENTSIHYENYPIANDQLINIELENEISIAKNIIRSARNIRLNVELPNKQPLRSLKIVTSDKELKAKIKNVEQIILNELNIKEIIFDDNMSEWVKYVCKPSYQILGPKLGKEINQLSSELESLNQEKITEIQNLNNFCECSKCKDSNTATNFNSENNIQTCQSCGFRNGVENSKSRTQGPRPLSKVRSRRELHNGANIIEHRRVINPL